MALFNLFKKKFVLFRCSFCYHEFQLSLREVRSLESLNPSDPVCSAKELCHICHTGFMIPVNYTDKHGKLFLFHQIKPKIKNLDPNTAFDRIFDDHHSQDVHFFGFLDDFFNKL